MKTTCTKCGTIYRIDPARVPERGIRARCAECNGVFRVAHGSESLPEATSASVEEPREAGREEDVPRAVSVERTAGTTGGTSPAASAEAAGDIEMDESPVEPSHSTSVSAEESDAPSGASSEASAIADETLAAGQPRASEEAPTPAPSPFSLADPQTRARRLARALVSDIVVYHPEKREASLRNRTLRVDFQDEIRKSWNEYVAQVGEPLARGTPYFREALNEILAGGERMF